MTLPPALTWREGMITVIWVFEYHG
jgi:hypothetical protein